MNLPLPAASPTSLKLPIRLYGELLQAAAEAVPQEGVWLLSGPTNDDISRIWHVKNVHPAPQRHFLADPVQTFDALRRIAIRGELLVAVAHSHPRGPLEPSGEDIAAEGLGVAQIIVDVSNMQMAAYTPERGRWRPLALAQLLSNGTCFLAGSGKST